jgi:hypothetical protein
MGAPTGFRGHGQKELRSDPRIITVLYGYQLGSFTVGMVQYGMVALPDCRAGPWSSLNLCI